MNTQEKTETRDRDSNRDRERARKLGTCSTYNTRASNQKALNFYNCQNLILKHKVQKWEITRIAAICSDGTTEHK